MKQCTKCKRHKSIQMFHKRGTINTASICNICDRKRVATYKTKNVERIKKRNRNYQRSKRQYIKYQVLRRLGGCCITPSCGCCELNWLTISHEANDGKQHRAIISSSQAIYQWAFKANDDELRNAQISIRCLRCNFLLAWQSESQIVAAIKREHRRIKETT